MFFVNCLVLFFLWVMSTCVLFCLVLLMDGFPSLIFIYNFFLLCGWGLIPPREDCSIVITITYLFEVSPKLQSTISHNCQMYDGYKVTKCMIGVKTK
jgi:hypothetical protein